jgi:sugar phosphate isomerase/epimerase
VRFSFSSGSFSAYSLPATFEIGHAAGADAIELMLTPRLADKEPFSLQSLEDTFRLPIASVHSIMRLRPVNEAQVLDDILESARLTRHLENCRTLVVHLPWQCPDRSTFSNRWLETVLQAEEILAPAKCAVSIENPDPPANSGTPDEWLSLTRWRVLIEEFGLRGTFDTSHAAACGWDLLGLAETAGNELDNIHLSDVGGRAYRNGMLNSLLHAHRPPGTGNLQIERFLARLAQTDFNGLITLEISPLRIPWYWLPSAINALADMLAFCLRSTGDARGMLPPKSRSRGPRSRIDR